MQRIAILLGLLSALSIPASTHALGFIIVGNEPIGLGGGYGKEVLAIVNTQERVYAYIHDWENTFYFKGGPNALNEGIRRFAAIPVDQREIILLPAPNKPGIHGTKIDYDWHLRVPGEHRGLAGRRGVKPEIVLPETRAILTVYIPEPLPAQLADTKQAQKWITDLGSDEFKIREHAAKELADLGKPAASILRAALKNKISEEARDRIERILAALSKEIRADVLKFPEGVSVVCLDDLLARARKELAHKAPEKRSDAAWQLIHCGAPAEEVLPDLEKMLRTETSPSSLAGAASAVWHLGAAGKPLVPLLKNIAQSDDKNLANISQQAISHIEKATAEPTSEEDKKRFAIIRKGIRESLTSKQAKTGN